ncbi:HAD-IB family phosphatase [Roseospira marina]|uniref:HAD-IB family phosphatase n=1 Tax=Roseospira marina TaxID=140057 RepID=A0A5M6ID15_9PROT|nr:HAD-IB family phosphatase [Roseospira marina]KAA5605857.1 HAD-IB family phosphatase [Roseospira marina]MBB4313676.1 HAD superfamily hydrolase (TIGR01490 family) [Roseospira marina]MBB5086838.1 HAD superfamily hydrolase (TIGR01490 family) [Roseospira marina]
MPKGAAIFDFDRTLVREETLAMFLRTVVGQRTFIAACCAAASASAYVRQRRVDAFRAELLRRTLAGRTVSQAKDAAERLFPRLRWIAQTTDALAGHQDAGRPVLVATGSLSVYMPTLLALKGIEVDGLLSTEMEVDADVLTGRMKTPSCTWAEKARRVKAWLADSEGPVWAYGNLPHDGAMLALADHPTVLPT